MKQNVPEAKQGRRQQIAAQESDSSPSCHINPGSEQGEVSEPVKTE